MAKIAATPSLVFDCFEDIKGPILGSVKGGVPNANDPAVFAIQIGESAGGRQTIKPNEAVAPA